MYLLLFATLVENDFLQVDNMPTSQIRFNSTMIVPLGELISKTSTCAWCLDGNDILQTVEGIVANSLRFG